MWLKDKYKTMSVEEIAEYCDTYPSVIATTVYNFKLDTKENLSEYLGFL
jgi:hypothetical protein